MIEGQLVNGKLNGFGRVIFFDLTYAIGYFKDNKLHGYGEYHKSFGRCIKGQWRDYIFKGARYSD